MERTKEMIAELQDAQGKPVTNGCKKYQLKIVGDFGTEIRKIWKTSKARAITEGLILLEMLGAKKGKITCMRVL